MGIETPNDIDRAAIEEHAQRTVEQTALRKVRRTLDEIENAEAAGRRTLRYVLIACAILAVIGSSAPERSEAACSGAACGGAAPGKAATGRTASGRTGSTIPPPCIRESRRRLRAPVPGPGPALVPVRGARPSARAARRRRGSRGPSVSRCVARGLRAETLPRGDASHTVLRRPRRRRVPREGARAARGRPFSPRRGRLRARRRMGRLAPRTLRGSDGGGGLDPQARHPTGRRRPHGAARRLPRAPGARPRALVRGARTMAAPDEAPGRRPRRAGATRARQEDRRG